VQKYLTERELSRLIGLSLSTLRNDRSLKRGVPYIKIGRSVRYAIGDVELYLAGCKIVTGQKKGGGAAKVGCAADPDATSDAGITG
jgi:hypothetical protein